MCLLPLIVFADVSVGAGTGARFASGAGAAGIVFFAAAGFFAAAEAPSYTYAF